VVGISHGQAKEAGTGGANFNTQELRGRLSPYSTSKTASATNPTASGRLKSLEFGILKSRIEPVKYDHAGLEPGWLSADL